MERTTWRNLRLISRATGASAEGVVGERMRIPFYIPLNYRSLVARVDVGVVIVVVVAVVVVVAGAATPSGHRRVPRLSLWSSARPPVATTRLSLSLPLLYLSSKLVSLPL